MPGDKQTFLLGFVPNVTLELTDGVWLSEQDKTTVQDIVSILLRIHKLLT